MRGLLNAIIPDTGECPDGRNKEEVLDKYTYRLMGWCLASINPLREETFQELKKEYLDFIGKNYKNKFGIEADTKAGDALQEHIQDFKYLPVSNSLFKKRQNIRGIFGQSILLNPITDKYEINIPTDSKYKNNNILIESRAICSDSGKIYDFYKNSLGLVRLVVYYKYDNNTLPRVLISFDHYNDDGIIFEIQPRLGS